MGVNSPAVCALAESDREIPQTVTSLIADDVPAALLDLESGRFQFTAQSGAFLTSTVQPATDDDALANRFSIRVVNNRATTGLGCGL